MKEKKIILKFIEKMRRKKTPTMISYEQCFLDAGKLSRS